MWEVILTGTLLGIGLAMDAFAVSVSDGLKDGNMSWKKGAFIAFVFAFFQLAMPLIGYFVGHAFVSYIDNLYPLFSLYSYCFFYQFCLLCFIFSKNKLLALLYFLLQGLTKYFPCVKYNP